MNIPTIAIVGEAWDVEEERLKIPFVGPSGALLLQMLDESSLMPLTPQDHFHFRSYWSSGKDSNYLALIWAAHPEVLCTNVFNLHPEGNNLALLCTSKSEGAADYPPLLPGKYLKAEYVPHVQSLLSLLRERSPNLILALGNTAAWAVLRKTSISKIRGTAVESIVGIKCLPAYHPAAILRQYDLRAVTVLDFQKAKRESAFREIKRPERTVYIEPDLKDLEWFHEAHIAGAKRLAVDIETNGDQITCIGFAPSRETAIVVPFQDFRKGGNYWATADEELLALRWIRRVLESPAGKVFQNGLFDLHRIFRGYGIRVLNCVDDTMLLSHSLHPEAPKGLAYLGSVWSNESSWKLDIRHSKTIKKEA